MVRMRRLLTVLAILALPGCAVGPQEDLYVSEGPDNDQRDADSGAASEADGDADADGDDMPPTDEGGYPDDGADFGADPGAGEGSDAAGVEDLDGHAVPGLPEVPRPGVFPPRPGGPDLEASDFPPDPADLGAVDGPGDDGRS